MRLFDGFERTNRVDTIQHRIHEQLHEQRESHGRAGRNHIAQRLAFHFEIQCGHVQRGRQQSADETSERQAQHHAHHGEHHHFTVHIVVNLFVEESEHLERGHLAFTF